MKSIPRWNKEKRSTLALMAKAGSSASQIANHLGGFTRSAVLNEASRLRISLAKRNPRLVASHEAGSGNAIFIEQNQQTIARFIRLFPESGVSLITAKNNQCRWPCINRGSDNMPMCCGKKTTGKRHYCDVHFAIS